MFLHVLHVRNYAFISFVCKLLCRHYTLIAKVIFCINVYFSVSIIMFYLSRGWSGGAMVLGKLPVPGRPTILITVGQGPIALAVGAGGGGLDIFTLFSPFSSFSLSLGDGPI